jgi:Domain of unknown function (DUF4129)
VRSMHRAAIAALIVSGFPAVIPAGAQPVKIPEPQTTVRWHDVSIEDYRRHMVALESLVEACAKARDVKVCDPALVGPDDRLAIIVGGKTEPRLIRYGWLRVLFSQAEDPDEKEAKPAVKDAGKHPVTITDQPATSQLLKDAKARLERDLAQSKAPAAPAPNYGQEHAVMREVLEGKDFRNLQQEMVRDSILEKLENWLNRFFASAANLKAHSAWVGRIIVWGFILGVCVALVYSLLRLERRWRVRLTPDDDRRPAPGAASARDWQLWLEDARRAAASARWREAIHFVYWAAISRLESRRLWPADRARTPREYLALVAQEDPRKPGLSQLTATFERFWYGGRAAGEPDYQNAERLASTLIGGGPSGEGGAR